MTSMKTGYVKTSAFSGVDTDVFRSERQEATVSTGISGKGAPSEMGSKDARVSEFGLESYLMPVRRLARLNSDGGGSCGLWLDEAPSQGPNDVCHNRLVSAENPGSQAAWYDPARYAWQPGAAAHSSHFQHCPAHHSFARDLYVLRSPFDLHLNCALREDGCELDVGDQSSIRREELARMIKVHPHDEWREADKPLFQLMLSY